MGVYRRVEYSRREPIEDAQLAPIGGLAEAEGCIVRTLPIDKVLTSSDTGNVFC